MDILAFISATLALLLAPGPTNTLMALAGAQGKLRRVLRLMPAEILGYLTTILPLVYLGSQVLERWPLFATLLKVAAAGWVMVLAFKLWRTTREQSTSSTVTIRQVYVTTLLNPKALIFGLVFLPTPAEDLFLQRLGLFCFLVIAVALIWGAGGTLAQGRRGNSSRRLHIIQRIAALWLAFVSVSLLASMVQAG